MSQVGRKEPEMRIAIVTDSYLPTRDGVVVTVITMRKTLEELGHTVFVIAPDPGEEYREEGVIYFPATKFKKYPEYFIPIYPSNKREILESLNLDIIHIHGITFMALKALIASHTTHIPTVMTYDTNVVEAMQFYSPLKCVPMDLQIKLAWIYLRNFLKRPDCIIALTPATVKDFEDNDIKTRRTEVIPMGIDARRFKEGIDGSGIRAKYGLSDNRVLIHVGRVSYEKHIEIVVEAMKHLPADIKLIIVGRGPAFDFIKNKIDEDGLSDRIMMAGFVPDDELANYYAAADVAVSASKFETLGLTVIEAMACGLPAACANGGAYPHFVKDDYNGYLFEGSPESCSEAIQKCFSNRSVLEGGIRQTAIEFSLDTIGRKMIDLFEDIIQKKQDSYKKI